MRTFLACLTVVLAALAAAMPVLADEAARYSFASAQGGTSIGVAAGGEGKGALFFYNVDGNRITHVTLTATGAPLGWEVSLDPPAREVGYDVRGEVVRVRENLPVEPSPLLAREARDLPAGVVCIPVPGRGYAVAKVAHLVVKVPEGEAPGTKAGVRVAAEASWLGQSGAATIKQARNFDFTVEVVRAAAGHSETLLPPGAGGPAEPSQGTGSLLADVSWLLPMGAGAALALGTVLVVGKARGRRGRS